ncbi:hypothetical protein OV079_14660 [Nannocystis pusilla]|uniref:Uncharacterized protein n=1 Tax=Nannocystis pusilla TaxID=889268 RepID=A0A9X3EMK4_9BACT|nr:hypothetical protein [Nannocystis pusilla]MCY1006772.1 hypothetical protein [Nannocystis pusilla]
MYAGVPSTLPICVRRTDQCSRFERSSGSVPGAVACDGSPIAVTATS